MDEKKKWSKPKLIVLARSNPEEMVLGGCKYTGYTNARKGNQYCVPTHCDSNGPS